MLCKHTVQVTTPPWQAKAKALLGSIYCEKKKSIPTIGLMSTGANLSGSSIRIVICQGIDSIGM
jgi:hypothetical protein